MEVYTLKLLIINLKDYDEKYFHKAWKLYEKSFPREKKNNHCDMIIYLHKLLYSKIYHYYMREIKYGKTKSVQYQWKSIE